MSPLTHGLNYRSACDDRCNYGRKTCLLLELASVLLLVYRPAAVGQDSLQHANQNDESFQPHGDVPRETVSTLSSRYTTVTAGSCRDLLVLVSTLLLLSMTTTSFLSLFKIMSIVDAWYSTELPTRTVNFAPTFILFHIVFYSSICYFSYAR